MKITSKKELVTSKYFKVTQEIIEHEGRTFNREFVERTPAVLVIPYTKDNTIYMESQFRVAFGRYNLEVVAGHIEEGDTPLETAKKELLEEAGLSAKTWHKLAEWELGVNMRAKMHLFAATDLIEGKTDLEEDEDITMVTMHLDDVLAKIETAEFSTASHIAALLFFKKLREEGKI
jgi:ADP-ribose pyrophosphatase